MRFPWSIYHRPLHDNLMEFIQTAKTLKLMSVLIIGPGEFHEAQSLFDLGFQVSVLDIDPRVIEDLRNRFPDKISNFYLVSDNFDEYPTESFDIIYAKEVIEHIPTYPEFLAKISSILSPGGKLWLSTPNYGSWPLPFLESTFLEVVARLNGFSRKHIHPAKFSKKKLMHALEDAGFKDNVVTEMPLKLSLTSVSSKKFNT